MSDWAPFVRRDAEHVHPWIDGKALAEYFDPIIEKQIEEIGDETWKTPSVGNFGSAYDVRVREYWRKHHGLISKPNDQKPVDVFVWARGEPADSDLSLTRIGGRPIVDDLFEWPRRGKKAAGFVAQFNFADSRDLTPEGLPGDILLHFNFEPQGLPEPSQDVFVWVDSSRPLSLAEPPREAPEQAPFRAWAVRYRTEDEPSLWDQAYELEEDDRFEDQDIGLLPVTWATKIGGMPYDSQTNDPEPPGPEYRFLCQLVSVQLAEDVPWPYANEEAERSDVHDDAHEFMICDMGEVSLWVKPDGTISSEGSFS